MTERILFVILILSSLKSQAQRANDGNRKMVFGVSAGINLTNSKAASYLTLGSAWRNYYKSSMRVGFNVKGIAEIPIKKTFSLQPELGFSQYNQKQDYSTGKEPETRGSLNYHDRITVNSIGLTVLLKCKTKFFDVLAGPKIEYLVSVKSKNVYRAISPYTGDVSGGDRTINFKKAGKANNLIPGLIFGIERLFTKRFSAGVNYQLGLTDISDTYFYIEIKKIRGIGFYGCYRW